MKTDHKNHLFIPGILVVLLALFLSPRAGQPAVHAAAIVVNTLDDESNSDGDCSLREAIEAAETDAIVDACGAGGGADTITFDPALTAAGDAAISLTILDPDGNQFGPTALVIQTNITIQGPSGENGMTIRRDGSASSFRLFHVLSGGSLILENLTISGGRAQGGHGEGPFGPASAGNGATNFGGGAGGGGAGMGGAIFNQGSVTLNGVTISGSSALGGNGFSGESASRIGGDGGDPNGGFGSGTHFSENFSSLLPASLPFALEDLYEDGNPVLFDFINVPESFCRFETDNERFIFKELA